MMLLKLVGGRCSDRRSQDCSQCERRSWCSTGMGSDAWDDTLGRGASWSSIHVVHDAGWLLVTGTGSVSWRSSLSCDFDGFLDFNCSSHWKVLANGSRSLRLFDCIFTGTLFCKDCFAGVYRRNCLHSLSLCDSCTVGPVACGAWAESGKATNSTRWDHTTAGLFGKSLWLDLAELSLDGGGVADSEGCKA